MTNKLLTDPEILKNLIKLLRAFPYLSASVQHDIIDGFVDRRERILREGYYF